ncbi:Uncharacterised protein [Klebsiella pneumoniae]|nr:Uncharacterised protein [Klebsiella pneumoniae]
MIFMSCNINHIWNVHRNDKTHTIPNNFQVLYT